MARPTGFSPNFVQAYPVRNDIVRFDSFVVFGTGPLCVVESRRSVHAMTLHSAAGYQYGQLIIFHFWITQLLLQQRSNLDPLPFLPFSTRITNALSAGVSYICLLVAVLMSRWVLLDL